MNTPTPAKTLHEKNQLALHLFLALREAMANGFIDRLAISYATPLKATSREKIRLNSGKRRDYITWHQPEHEGYGDHPEGFYLRSDSKGLFIAEKAEDIPAFISQLNAHLKNPAFTSKGITLGAKTPPTRKPLVPHRHADNTPNNY